MHAVWLTLTLRGSMQLAGSHACPMQHTPASQVHKHWEHLTASPTLLQQTFELLLLCLLLRLVAIKLRQPKVNDHARATLVLVSMRACLHVHDVLQPDVSMQKRVTRCMNILQGCHGCCSDCGWDGRHVRQRLARHIADSDELDPHRDVAASKLHLACTCAGRGRSSGCMPSACCMHAHMSVSLCCGLNGLPYLCSQGVPRRRGFDSSIL